MGSPGRCPPRPGPAGGRGRLPPPRTPRDRSGRRRPPSAPTKKTSSPIILTTRPPARTALDQAADSKRVRARLCSRRLRDCAQAVEPTRSTKPSATTSVEPSTPARRRPPDPTTAAPAWARRWARSKASSTMRARTSGTPVNARRRRLGDASTGELVGSLAHGARTELGEEECDGRLGHVDGGCAEYPGESEDGLLSHQRRSLLERVEQTDEVRGKLGVGLRRDAGSQQHAQHVGLGDTAARGDLLHGRRRRPALRHEIAGDAWQRARCGVRPPSARWWRRARSGT